MHENSPICGSENWKLASQHCTSRHTPACISAPQTPHTTQGVEEGGINRAHNIHFLTNQNFLSARGIDLDCGTLGNGSDHWVPVREQIQEIEIGKDCLLWEPPPQENVRVRQGLDRDSNQSTYFLKPQYQGE